MAQHLRDLAATAPDHPAVADDRVAWTRAELNDRTNRVMAVLAAAGLGARDRVGIFASNAAEWAALVMAAVLGNQPPVPINAHLGEREVEHILRAAHVSVLFTDEDHEGLARAATSAAGIAAEAVITFGTPEWEAHLAAASGAEPAVDTNLASPIFFTSGTTGLPKGTQMAQVPDDVPLATYLGKMGELWRNTGMTPDTRHLVIGPMYHSSPGSIFSGLVQAGGSSWIMRKFDPAESLRLIQEHRITLLGVVPTNFVRWLQLPDDVRAGYDVSSLQVVSHTAAACPVNVKRAMIEWFGPILLEGYGGSEIGAVCAIDSATWLEHPGSVGRPFPGYELRIIDDAGQPLPVGEVGRIFARSEAGLDIAYLEEPEKTAAAHVDGYFTLGDLGWLDDDGFLFIADRRDDLVVSGGVNIYPAEIEAVLLDHPAVRDVGVFGVPDDEWGSVVRAAVELHDGIEPGDELVEELLAFTRERLAHFKAPKQVDFHAALPRLDNGKLYRRLLREAAVRA